MFLFFAGYSTDGASPGGTGPPEYYINIRTGKHYFPSPAPTPTSPQPDKVISQFHSTNHCITTSFLSNDSSLEPESIYPPQFYVTSFSEKEVLSNPSFTQSCLPMSSSQISNNSGFSTGLTTFVPESAITNNVSEIVEIKSSNLSTSVPSNFSFSKSPSKKSPQKSQLSSLRLFLKSPKQDKGKAKVDIQKTPSFETKKKSLSPTKNKKWYKQPFQKFAHRRTDSSDINSKNEINEIKKDNYFEKNIYYLTKENTASPRQRNRIKTNPWLPTEPMSSQNFHSLQSNFSPSLPRNRSCTNTPLQNRKTSEVEVIQNRLKEMNVKYEKSKEYLNNLEKVVNRHVGGHKICLELSDHSEEDLTLNEMMGTFNESYVYEKETDILSDSDPTDCEDYVSDSEADNGGDEQDSHDDELDFIDNGSIAGTDENLVGNTGKCTYHDVHIKKNSFLYRSDRHNSRKDSDHRKSFRKEHDSKCKKIREEKKRRSIRKSLKEGNENTSTIEGIKAKVELNENVGGLNLSRVLMQRMMTKNGSKSAEGTPMSIRRQNIMQELRGNSMRDKTKPQTLRGKLLDNKFLIDIEGDKKYNELIVEAEYIFQSMQNSPVIQNRKKMNMNILDDKNRQPYKSDNGMESVEIWRKAESMCCPNYTFKSQQEKCVRKSPKNLGLNLTVEDTPNKMKNLEFIKDKKLSFKAKSSAHSPLDPLGPTFRNFSVFKPVNIDQEKTSSSSSEDSEPKKISKAAPREPTEPEPKSLTPGSPIVPIAFQSVDLGKPLSSYCPQSEPVKRKIYSCSKTYDKLVKRFENSPNVFEESCNKRARHGSLIAKTRAEGEFSKLRGRGTPNPLRQAKAGYSPNLSPKKVPKIRNGFGSPTLVLRHSLGADEFR